ncbi:MAG TPA: BadF/BadG/BcrA/BcrD ATPase family protein [Pseudothermotoga sp.]|nr:BadF/BadG/BcrA/BcrD ATPase family protein [Pseudothermotoga sp.]HOK83465.1 BadF/BadG/BcrA/BcrD ATPase family protein [Pseudothermotoga sp.]HPP69538.1 BadF/BadG/BcrA/BcrD ATPase family protein [Pseudothermotoga sp.]
MKILGIDGGGTSLKATVVQGDKTIHRTVLKKGVNLSAVDVNQIEETIKELYEWSGVVDLVRAAFSGAGSQQRRSLLKQILHKYFPNSSLQIFTDAEGVLYSCYENEPVTVVIAGTGSVVMGIDSQQMIHRAGGWGHLFDDEGGAFSVVCKLIKAALNYKDGIGPFDSVFDELLNFYGASCIEDLVELQRSKDFKESIASFAASMTLTPLVVKVLKEDYHVLLKRTKRVLRKTGANKLYLHGGMFKIPKVEQMFVENLSKVEILKLREDVDYLLATNQSLLNL